jgi:hypothetical protein
MIQTTYFGLVDIEPWEYSVGILYLLVLYIFFARQKNLRIRQEPEYRYLLWGLYAKVLGGVLFSLVYFYYYGYGDTISYYYSSLALSQLALQRPMDYLHVLFGDNSPENWTLFDSRSGYPYSFLYADDRTYMVVRLMSILGIFTFKSYLITTVVLASLSYVGVWKCYRTFVSYYPSLASKLALAVLFMPSSVFWGSAILKDTFTFTATCWYVHAVDMFFFRKRARLGSLIALLITSFVLITIKPYIFMSLVPVSLLWVLHARISLIRNALLKYLVVPLAAVSLSIGTFLALSYLGDRLDKFSLDSVLKTVVITQQDMLRTEEYGSNNFSVGELQPTWSSILSKAPVAVAATLFRPVLVECRSAIMFLAGFENLFILLLFLRVMVRGRVIHVIRPIYKNPLVMVCMVFSISYAFMTGISTPNFGALVRFKIPLLPLFISALYIIGYLAEQRKKTIASGKRFEMNDYRNGEPARRRAHNALDRPI